MISKIIILCLIFGFTGFLIESVGNSYKKKHFVYAGDKLFWGIPLLPIYSLGGLLIHFLINSLCGITWYWTIIFTWLVACGFEYVGGYFCHKVLKRKLWNYSKKKYNIRGYICAENCLWWLFFVSIYYFVFFDIISNFLAR